MARRAFGYVEMRKRKGGKRYYASYMGPDGKRHTPNGRSFPTKQDADAWLAGERRKIDLDTWEPPEAIAARQKQHAITVSEYFDAMIDRYGYLHTTANAYRSLFRTRITAQLGRMPMVEVTRSDVVNWWVWVRNSFPGTEKRNADAYTLLATIFNRAVDDELLEATPVRIKGGSKAPEPEQVPLLTVEQLTGVIKAMPKHYKVAVLVAAACALRIGEWSELRRKDVRVSRQGESISMRLHIARAVKDDSPGKSVGATKGGRQRWASVPAVLVPDLLDHLEKMGNKSPEALLFPNADGKWTDRRRFNKLLKQAGKTVGRGDISSHDLRHFGGTEFSRAGATLAEVMARLGHSTTASALRYQHATAERDASVANDMNVPTLEDATEK